METVLVIGLLAVFGVQLYWPFVKASDPKSERAAAPLREPVSSS